MSRKSKRKSHQHVKFVKATSLSKKAAKSKAVSKARVRKTLEKTKLKKLKVVPSLNDSQNEDQSGKDEKLGGKSLFGMEGMEVWQAIGVNNAVIRGLQECGFKQPTPVQQQAIPLTLQSEGDIVGAAETGSGKTLAFGIPILEFVMKSQQADNSLAKIPSKKKKKKYKDIEEVGGVVDLNMVYHYEIETDGRSGNEGNLHDNITEESPAITEVEDAMTEDTEEGDATADEEMVDDSEGNNDGKNDLAESSEDEVVDGEDGNASGSDSQDDEDMKADTGLVEVRDNIPDDVFLATIKAGVQKGSPQPMSEAGAAALATGPESAGQPKGPGLTGQPEGPEGPVAIILVPTRELAMQIHAHITAVSKYTRVKCCPVVGGISSNKQERLLEKCPAIVVATVGRLWMFMTEGHPYLSNFSALKFLVLDEADKMVETGHYQDLWNIIDKLNGVQGSKCRRNLVYSATLMVSRRISERRNKKYVTSSQQDVMDKLMKQIGLKDNAAIVDLTRSAVTVQSLTETKVMCTSEDKIVFLYYFLLQFPGRTIIFVNTIKCLQRLRSVLELLKLKPLPLHATMQQRQRLKNLDRFNGDSSGLLVASDVAARGLDFVNVDHVIHYQVPMNTELYVHRSGRTARAQKEGLSVILVGPEDLRAYQNIRKTLNKDQNLKDFPVEPTYLSQLRPRVQAAAELQKLSSQGQRKKSRENWLTKAARELDIELDEEDKEESVHTSKAESARIAQLKMELAGLLKKRILPPSLSQTYPTRFQDHGLLARCSADHHSKYDLLPGMATKTALAALKKK